MHSKQIQIFLGAMAALLLSGPSILANPPAPPAGGENVVGGSIRPIHARGGMGGEAGVAFLHSAAFKATVG